MGNISGNLNLAALEHKVVDGKKEGEKILCIPINANNLLLTEKRNVYIDIQAYPLKEIKEGSKNTHIVNQGLSKEVRDKLKEQDKYPPTLGNLVDWSKHSGGSEPEPNISNQDFDPQPDDLPF